MSCLGLEFARVSYLESLEVGGKSPLTLASYRRHLAELQGWLKDHDKPLTVEEIESSHIRGFLLYLSRRPKQPGFQHRNDPGGDLAPETLWAYFRTLSAFFSWAEAWGLVNGHQPMRNVQKPKAAHKEIRILGDEEVARLLALLDKPSVKKRTLYVAFSLMYRLGLRISEVCDLRLSDLNLKQGWLLVRGKAKRERRLPVRSSLEGMLQS